MSSHDVVALGRAEAASSPDQPGYGCRFEADGSELQPNMLARFETTSCASCGMAPVVEGSPSLG